MKPRSWPAAVIQGFTRELARRRARLGHPARTLRDLGGGARHFRHEHQPEAAEHAVDGSSGQRQAGGVLDGELDAFEPERGSAAPGDLDHLGSDVGREQLAARLDQRQQLEADLAGPGGEVEDPLPRSWLEQLDDPLREPCRCTRKQLPLALLAAATLRQASTCSAAAVAYAATPLKAGMMRSP